LLARAPNEAMRKTVKARIVSVAASWSEVTTVVGRGSEDIAERRISYV